jgi:GNAT superfamily N-acetyltransferase
MADLREFAVTETLRNGVSVTLRALREDDRARMAQAIRGLGRESIYTRLFSYCNELTEAGLDRVMRFDPEREVALVVTAGTGADEAIVGSGRYVVSGTGHSAEVAFVVAEDWQRLGIAGRILGHLAAIARERDITEFTADVLAENRSMLAVFAHCGAPMRTRREDGVLLVSLDLAGGTA